MRIRTAIILVIALVGLVAAAFLDVYTTTKYSCLECRATMTKRRVCGIAFQPVSYSPYFTEYLPEDARHQHRWRYCGSKWSYTLLACGIGCGKRHPIWDLPIPIQAEYAKLVPRSEMRETLQAIDSADRKTAEAAVRSVVERVSDSRR